MSDCWSDIKVTSTQYDLNIAPMCFAAWVVFKLKKVWQFIRLITQKQNNTIIHARNQVFISKGAEYSFKLIFSIYF